MNPNLQSQAEHIGASRDKLRSRLKQARSLLNKEFSALFVGGVIDYENKRMASSGGAYCLQWENDGTTNVGSVYVRRLGAKP